MKKIKKAKFLKTILKLKFNILLKETENKNKVFKLFNKGVN